MCFAARPFSYCCFFYFTSILNLWLFLCECICVCVCVCLLLCLFLFVCLDKRVCMCACVHVCMCACVPKCMCSFSFYLLVCIFSFCIFKYSTIHDSTDSSFDINLRWLLAETTLAPLLAASVTTCTKVRRTGMHSYITTTSPIEKAGCLETFFTFLHPPPNPLKLLPTIFI